jgi:alkanesulfonate monooxygenase SsuD/methylene tetrahydromethanopterin reductase-like flavin-dependent oxidoreductase (luciferase family)
VGRGSFTEAFPLFGLNFQDYDALFAEKLDLLLQLNEQEVVTWRGRFRPALQEQAIYPRPMQEKLPIWLGVGGTPASFVRAGSLGLPLMVAVIGGETHRFRPLIDLYREAGEKAGFAQEDLKVGLHSLGYVAQSHEEAVENYYPGYAETFTRIGKERGWPPVTRGHFEAQNSKWGAYLVGDSDEVAEKILRHSASLGGIDRFTFQLDNAGLSHQQLSETIALIGEEVIPKVKKGLAHV